MDKIKVVIVDDEELARVELTRLLSFFDAVEIVAQADNARDGLKQIRDNPDVDLVFLDIDMPEMDGLSLAALLVGQGCKVVFCTAYEKFAVKAFDLNSLDYLTKPVSLERLAQCLDKLDKFKATAATSRSHAEASHAGVTMDTPLMVNNGTQIKLITPSQIEKLFSVGNYVKIGGDGLDMLIQGTLAELATRLDRRYFFRASRSYLVNLQKVREIQLTPSGAFLLILQSGTEVEVSRRQSLLLKNLISL
jgi:two-component system, LytTR family, response regulator